MVGCTRPKARYNRWVMCVVVPFDHHLFHLCIVAVITHTVGPSPLRLDGKMVPSFPCLIPVVYNTQCALVCYCMCCIVHIVIYLLRVRDVMYALFQIPTLNSLSFPPSATPSIRELMSISVGPLNMIQSVGTRYPTLGIFLLEDDNAVLVEALKEENHHRVEEITCAIFQRWIGGTGRKPTT